MAVQGVNNMKKFCLCAIIFLLFMCSAMVFAGPPFFTDDPAPVEFRHWEVYAAYQSLSVQDDYSGAMPQVEVNYGALPELQLHLIAAGAFDKHEGEKMTYGLGDTEFGVKYRFIDETEQGPQVGIFPHIVLPTGNSGESLGNGNTQVFLPVWMQKSWGRWTTYGGGGLWINPGPDNKNWTYFGWLLQRDFSQYATLGFEIFHRTPSTVDTMAGTGFTFGGQINFSGFRHLLFSEGRDFSGPDLRTDYLAFQWTF
jgi:hypothetical protein